MRSPVRKSGPARLTAAVTVAAAMIGAAAAVAAPATQDEPAKAQAKGGAAATTRPGAPNEVLATVNGEKIPRRLVVDYMARLNAPSVEPQELYQYAVDVLVNLKLLNLTLKAQKVPVDEKRVDAEVAKIDTDMKKQGADLKQMLAENDMTPAELRDQIAANQRWDVFLRANATKDALAKYVSTHKERYDGTQVRASHILLKVDPAATEADKEKVKQRLLAIKKEIESGKISFADAADKYSQDELNEKTKSGGDLDYFPRDRHFVDSFSAAAFGLKPNVISDPVETEFGYHLIKVTDRKRPEQPFNVAEFLKQFEQRAVQDFAEDLQGRVVTEARKTAQIVVKPMPKDFLPPAKPAADAAKKDEAKKKE